MTNLAKVFIEEWDKVFTPDVRAALDKTFAEVDALMSVVTHCLSCGAPLESAPPVVCATCYLLEPR